MVLKSAKVSGRRRGAPAVARRRTFGPLVAAALVISLLAAACGGGSSNASSTSTTSSGSSGPAPSSVKIGLAGGYSLNFLPTVLAEGLGYYNDVASRYHTNIGFDVYGGGTAAEPAFLGGTDQFMVIGTNSWLGAVLQGKDQTAVFNQNVGLNIVVGAAEKNKASKGTDLSKFKGATWCQTGPVGTAHTLIELASGVYHLGVTPSNIVSVGSVSAYTPALQAGRCDLASEDLTSAANQELQGVGYTVLNTNDPPTSVQLAGQQIGIPLTTSHSFATQYPGLTQAIVDATLRAFLFLQQNINNPQAVYSKLPAAAQQQYPLPTFTKAFQLFAQASAPKYVNGEFTQQEANDTTALLQATGDIPGGTASRVNPGAVWWNKFVVQAYNDIGATPPSGSPSGPATLASKVGAPSSQAAHAVSTLGSSH